jgi:hypothetical protein
MFFCVIAPPAGLQRNVSPAHAQVKRRNTLQEHWY